MSDDTKKRASGMFDEAKGKAKEAWGKATNDAETQAEGQADQAEGKAKKAVGKAESNAKDKINDTIGNVTNDH